MRPITPKCTPLYTPSVPTWISVGSSCSAAILPMASSTSPLRVNVEAQYSHTANTDAPEKKWTRAPQDGQFAAFTIK